MAPNKWQTSQPKDEITSDKHWKVPLDRRDVGWLPAAAEWLRQLTLSSLLDTLPSLRADGLWYTAPEEPLLYSNKQTTIAIKPSIII